MSAKVCAPLCMPLRHVWHIKRITCGTLRYQQCYFPGRVFEDDWHFNLTKDVETIMNQMMLLNVIINADLSSIFFGHVLASILIPHLNERLFPTFYPFIKKKKKKFNTFFFLKSCLLRDTLLFLQQQVSYLSYKNALQSKQIIWRLSSLTSVTTPTSQHHEPKIYDLTPHETKILRFNPRWD